MRPNLVLLASAACLVTASAHADGAPCPDLKVSRRSGLSAGQAAAAMPGPPVEVRAPTHHLEVPSGPPDTVRISLERSECYGICPSYAIELRGDGSASYTGKAYVLVDGQHTFDVPKADVQCLTAQFRKADFWSLADRYAAEITDGTTYRLTLVIGGQTKTVVDYFGSVVGMPDAVTALEDEVDRIGANRWVKGDSETLESLRKEGFDFHSAKAGTLLANAAAGARDDLVLGLLEAGAPATGRMSFPRGRFGQTAIELASRKGRVAIVQALIAKDAFADGAAAVKESALRNAAASGNPSVVAEILKYRPNVNAQDREGQTALINMWRSQHFGADTSKTDIVAIARLLLEAGADPNMTDNTGSTALFSASNAEVVKMLVKAGAKIDVRNEYGSTPLLYAGSDDAAVALIEAGADTKVTDKFGGTLEQHAIQKNFPKTIQLLHDRSVR